MVRQRTNKKAVRVTAEDRKPLLDWEPGAEWPIYTGPLGVARMFASRDRYVLEMDAESSRNGKHNVFFALDPEGHHCEEWSLSYVSLERALRETFGVYFHRAGFNSITLGEALRAALDEEIQKLE